MLLLDLTFFILGLISSALAKPLAVVKHPDVLPCVQCNNGTYNKFWTDEVGSINYTNGAGGQFTVRWQDSGHFIAGKGWLPGATSRIINYSSSFNTSGHAYLSLYGWTVNPLVEYYVVESSGTIVPGLQTGLSPLGSITSDGATYNTYQTIRINQPSINGTATFRQLWSVRQTKRTSGSVTFANHANAWANAGLFLGSHNYQIVAVEGYAGSGSAAVVMA